MSRRVEYHLNHRFMISVENIEKIRSFCSPSGKFTWVTKFERLCIHTFVGVMGKYCDILIPEPKYMDSNKNYCFEIGEKIGSYDGNKRYRFCIRTWNQVHDPIKREKASNAFPGKGSVVIEEQEGQLALIAMFYNNGFFAQSFPQIRYCPTEDSDLMRIFMWQYNRFYRFLHPFEEDVRATGVLWSNLQYIKDCRDIVVLNRTASNALYDLARQLGWRKLTMKDRKKYGLGPKCNQWIRQDDPRIRTKVLPGVGEYTERAANNQSMTTTQYDGFIRTSHGLFEVE